ncbi:MAG TPA: 3-oxoadipate--succinyl-CoA transferase subunit A [Chloroflexi bacterium]|nr:3-oxoadipate--succinyl-CoA transferase subunit A [Chloroflexota bacterium]
MSKLQPAAEAIAANVRDGDTVYVAGFSHIIPFATAHEIIRQRRRGLTLARPTLDLVGEQLVAGGCVARIVSSYLGNPGFGTLRLIRERAEAGEIELEEYSHYGMIARLFAGASRLPFFPLVSYAGSDLRDVNPQIRTVTDPYTNQTITVVPPLRPDVALIHVQRAAEDGSSQAWGIVGDAREAAFAAERVILSCEELVPTEVIEHDPNRTIVPGFLVSALVHAPRGGHPGPVQGYYRRDDQFYAAWAERSRSREGIEQMLDEWIFQVADAGEYRRRLGEERLEALRVTSRPAGPVNYGG